MAPYATFFDTNTYLTTRPTVFDEVLAEEGRAQVAPYVDPWVAMELVARLRDPKHKKYRPARAAIKRLVRHAASTGCRSLRDVILVDSEEQVALLLFGRRLQKHRETLGALAAACDYVASVELDVPLDEIAPIVEEVAEHVAEAESSYARRVFDLLIRPICPDAETWDAVSRNRSLRDSASVFMRSEQALVMQAKSEVLRAHGEVDLPRPAEVAAIQAQAVLDAFRFALELQTSTLCGVVERGWSLDRPGRRNWIWDVLIAYNVGQSVGQRRLHLVTNDEHFHEVAARTGHGSLVLRLSEYREALRMSQTEQCSSPAGRVDATKVERSRPFPHRG